jgi:hypothetical protein
VGHFTLRINPICEIIKQPNTLDRSLADDVEECKFVEVPKIACENYLYAICLVK